MAKKKKSGGSYTATKKKGSVSLWVTLGAFVTLAAVIVGVFGYGTQGFKDWGFSRFAPKGNVEIVQPEQTLQTSGGGMVLSESVSDCGAELASYSVQREEFAAYSLGDNIESSYVLYAKVIPEEATFDTVTYSADWVNGDSEWAKGKDAADYVVVKQGTYRNPNAATVSCIKEFREPVAITATYEFDDRIKATVQADYVGDIWYRSNEWTGDSKSVRTINDGVCFTYLGHSGTKAPDLKDCIAYWFNPFFTYSSSFKIYDRATATWYSREVSGVEAELNKLGISTTYDFEDDDENQYEAGKFYAGVISFEGCEVGDEMDTPTYLEMMYAAVDCPTHLREKMKSIISRHYIRTPSDVDQVEFWAGYWESHSRKIYGSHIFDSTLYMDMFAGKPDSDADCFFWTSDGLMIYGDDVQLNPTDEVVFG